MFSNTLQLVISTYVNVYNKFIKLLLQRFLINLWQKFNLNEKINNIGNGKQEETDNLILNTASQTQLLYQISKS